MKPVIYLRFKIVDYDVLCPFCDEKWPKEPSPTLLRLNAAIMKSAYPSPRLGNPKGMRTRSFTHYVELCQQHRYETYTIPDGLRQGWPGVIDFNILPSRLTAMKPQLAVIVDDPSKSPFFKEVQNELALSGALFVSSIHGQLHSFHRSQPG